VAAALLALLLLHLIDYLRASTTARQQRVELYYCFTSALLLLYFCFTTALLRRASQTLTRALLLIYVLYYCFTAALLPARVDDGVA
jgi:uncharacterized membrane protein